MSSSWSVTARYTDPPFLLELARVSADPADYFDAAFPLTDSELSEADRCLGIFLFVGAASLDRSDVSGLSNALSCLRIFESIRINEPAVFIQAAASLFEYLSWREDGDEDELAWFEAGAEVSAQLNIEAGKPRRASFFRSLKDGEGG